MTCQCIFFPNSRLTAAAKWKVIAYTMLRKFDVNIMSYSEFCRNFIVLSPFQCWREFYI